MDYYVNMALLVHIGGEQPLWELSFLGIAHPVVGPFLGVGYL